MNSKKCDICGAYYSKYGNCSLDEYPPYYGISFIHVSKVINKKVDCCPDCLNSIEEFIRERNMAKKGAE